MNPRFPAQRARLPLLLCLLTAPALAAPDEEAITLKTLPNFTGEQILAAKPDEGSWSAMAIDPRGRIVVSPQDKEPMLRIALPAHNGDPVQVTKIEAPVTSAMGLLFAFDSLYVNGNGPQGFGLYRLRDTKGTDTFDEVKLLRRFEGEVSKEHGSHGLVLGPDQRIYLAQGNHVLLPHDIGATSPYQHFAEDQLLPSASYGLSSGDRAQAPCGHILRMDAEGRDVEVFAGGFRNIYDLAFDPQGELFTYDSDTEFNWGLPWYVPTRILHVIPGADFGFREGTGKWPTYYPDTLPSVVDVGLGSPTGVKFGTRARFPEKYRRALFGLDWTFGRILAVHLEPQGGTYRGTFETFLQGRPLNLTALDFGPDGAMYFITGGRKTRSALYRVRYTGAEPQDLTIPPLAPAVVQRRALTALQGKAGPTTMDRLWPELGNKDRTLAYAARLALESQPVAQWHNTALTIQDSHTAATALLALARVGNQGDRADVLTRVSYLWPPALADRPLQLALLRVASVALARHGRPYPETRLDLQQSVNEYYPHLIGELNRELTQVLIALETPQTVERTMWLLRNSTTLEDQLHYVFHLRQARTGWPLKDRESYFRWFTQPHDTADHPPEVKRWFAEVHLHYADGGSLLTYLTNIRQEAAAALTDAERQALGPLINAPLLPAQKPAEIKPHAFVKEWRTDDLLPLVRRLTLPRSMESGREVFTAAGCIACHRYANEGGAVGPDLNAVAYKLGARDMVESILEPSKVIADQFQNTIVELTTGELRIGRILKKGKDKDRVALSLNPLGGDRVEIPRSEIRSIKPSPISPMPPRLLNAFTEDEILDLLAYLGFGTEKD